MKKLISLALCVVMICMALVSCEDVIGEDLHKEGGLYEQGLQSNVSDPLAELDFYIAVSDDIDLTNNDIAAQYNTVQTQLNAELKDLYNIKLYIHYVNEKDYDAEIKKAVQPGYNRDGKGRTETADVILINSKPLYDELVADNMLLSLNSQLAKNAYGMLNAHVAKSLWDATATEIDGQSFQFVVPNNRVIGEYTYLLLDRAEIQYHAYSEPSICHGNYYCKACNYTYNTSKPFSLNYSVKRDGSDALEAKVMHFPAGTKLEDAYAKILEAEKLTFGDLTNFVSKIECANPSCNANFIVNHYKCETCGKEYNGTKDNSFEYVVDLTGRTVKQEYVTVEKINGEDVEVTNKVVIEETVDAEGQYKKVSTIDKTYTTVEVVGEGDEAEEVTKTNFYQKVVITEVIEKDAAGKVTLTRTEVITDADDKETALEPVVEDAELVDLTKWQVTGTYKNGKITSDTGSYNDLSMLKRNLKDSLPNVLKTKGTNDGESLPKVNPYGEEFEGTQSVTYSVDFAEIRTIGCWDVSTPFEENFTASYEYRMIDLMDVESEDLIRIFKDMYQHELGDAWESKLEECIVTGTYADKAYYENGEHTEAEGDAYYCKIMAYPQITAEEAFESAFAVVRDNVNSLRCMDFIKAINLDVKIRNLLQFGKETVNYTFDVDPVTKEKTVVPIDGNEYVMNPLYTGNIFTMYYVGEDWDAEIKSWAGKQNEEAVFVKAD